MTKNLWLLMLIMFVSYGCKKAKQSKLPLPEEKVVDLLVDLRFAEETIDYFKEDADSIHLILLDSIYKIHKVDSTFVADMMTILKNDLTSYYTLEKKVHKKLKIYLDDPDVK